MYLFFIENKRKNFLLKKKKKDIREYPWIFFRIIRMIRQGYPDDTVCVPPDILC